MVLDGTVRKSLRDLDIKLRTFNKRKLVSKPHFKIAWPKVAWPKIRLGLPLFSLPKYKLKLPAIKWPQIHLSWPQRIRKPHFFSRRVYRPFYLPKINIGLPAMIFVSVAMIVFLLVQAAFGTLGLAMQVRAVSSVGARGVSLLQEGAANAFGSPALAKAYFDAAQDSFQQAQDLLKTMAGINNYPGVYSAIGTTNEILTFGEKTSQAGSLITSGLEKLKQFRPSLDSSDETKKPIESLREVQKDFLQAQQLIGQAADSLQNAKISLLPSSLASKLSQAKNKMPMLEQAIGKINNILPLMLDMVGGNGPRRYLVVFQNSGEIRPTGGFIGSLALVDFNEGVMNVDVKDVYDLDGQLRRCVEPPAALKKVTDCWYLRDANFSPDFPTAARQIAWFLELEGGPSVDGVVALNQNILIDLLGLTGPLDIDGVDFNQDNFYFRLVSEIESKRHGQTTPKKILFDLIAAIQQRVFTGDKWPELLDVLLNDMRDQNIQFYFSDGQKQKLLEDRYLAGQIKPLSEKEDYVYVVNTSLSGNKSDYFIEQAVLHETEIKEDGQIVDRLTLKRKHVWNDENDQLFSALDLASPTLRSQEDLKDIIGRGANRSYVRVYVPTGAALQQVFGVSPADVTSFDENGRTVLAFEMEVQPKEEKQVVLTYGLPFDLNVRKGDIYRFAAQRQPGMGSEQFLKSITTSGSVSLIDDGDQRKEKSWPLGEDKKWQIAQIVGEG